MSAAVEHASLSRMVSRRPSVAIVTAADSRYYGFLDGLLASLNDAGVSQSWRRCVMDVGLTDDQRSSLETRGVEVIGHDWCLDFPGKSDWDEHRKWFKAMVNRPFLPSLFPGHGVYLWIDCDTWVQDSSCLQGLIEVAVDRDTIALVVETFARSIHLTSRGPDGSLRTAVISEQGIRDNIARCYTACFGAETARLAHGPITNSGVFAISAASSAWRVWQRFLARGLSGGVQHPLVEQQSLNLACLEGEIPYVSMPSICNWNLTTLQPVWNAAIASLVDPRQPEVAIGVIHCTDLKHCIRLPVHDIRGQLLQIPLRYHDFRAWRVSSASDGR